MPTALKLGPAVVKARCPASRAPILGPKLGKFMHGHDTCMICCIAWNTQSILVMLLWHRNTCINEYSPLPLTHNIMTVTTPSCYCSIAPRQGKNRYNTKVKSLQLIDWKIILLNFYQRVDALFTIPRNEYSWRSQWL